MGEVWLADQQEPVRRQVAVKIFKAVGTGSGFLARFDSERQALARMDHPAVAIVHDAGTARDGRPFFAMEHVPGLPITEYCDREGLGIEQRVELLRRVCDGVQHAHRKGIIHRDLKPSNVLVSTVDGAPHPKIIDFGVAKALDRPLSADTVFTEMGTLVGTPEYMSPEQASAGDREVDTRTDVYALGVLLYELLTGALPFESAELRASGYDGLRRIVLEQEPPRPSARLEALPGRDVAASARGTEPGSLVRRLRGDLDWIAMRALEKDPARRYQSPSALSDDLARHLANEPVQAGPPTVRYRARKFLRRHRIAVGVAAALLAVLALGVGATIWQAIRATRAERQALALAASEAEQRREAERQAAVASEVVRFLNQDLLGQADPNAAGRDVTVREVLERAERSLDGRFPDEPAVEARVRDTLGQTWFQLGDMERARAQQERALDLFRQAVGETDRHTISAMHDLGFIHLRLGDAERAGELLDGALRASRRAYGDDDKDTIKLMVVAANLRTARGEYDEAGALLRESLAGHRALYGDAHAETLVVLRELGVLDYRRGDVASAERYFRAAYEATRDLEGEDGIRTILLLNDLAMVLARQDLEAEAEPMFRNVREHYRERFGPEHPYTMILNRNLAHALEAQGKPGAADLLERTLAVQRRKIGPESPDALDTEVSLSGFERRAGRLAEAEARIERVLATLRRLNGDEHPGTLAARIERGAVRRELGRLEASRTDLATAREGALALGADHPRRIAATHELARTLRALEREAEAAALLDEALAAARRRMTLSDKTAMRILVERVELHIDSGDCAAAMPLLEEGRRARSAAPRDDRLRARLEALAARCSSSARQGAAGPRREAHQDVAAPC